MTDPCPMEDPEVFDYDYLIQSELEELYDTYLENTFYEVRDNSTNTFRDSS